MYEIIGLVPAEGRPHKYLTYNQQTADLSPEEQKLRQENLEARRDIQIDGVRALWAAVALQAINDYKAVRSRNDIHAKATQDECRRFFNSELFGEITDGLDANDVDIHLDKNCEMLKKVVHKRRKEIRHERT